MPWPGMGCADMHAFSSFSASQLKIPHLTMEVEHFHDLTFSAMSKIILSPF